MCAVVWPRDVRAHVRRGANACRGAQVRRGAGLVWPQKALGLLSVEEPMLDVGPMSEEGPLVLGLDAGLASEEEPSMPSLVLGLDEGLMSKEELQFTPALEFDAEDLPED